MKQQNVIYDYIDRNPLNNCKSNLRECTIAQNGANRVKQKGKYSSKYKGVYLDKNRKYWTAYIHFNNKKKYLGYYKTEKEAALEYNKAALEYFGEFAVLNEL